MTTPTSDNLDERFVPRREAELLISNTAAIEDERDARHLREHAIEADALDKALGAANNQQLSHNSAHDRAHEAHEEKHRSENEAVHVALAALDRERIIHAEAHDREHTSHLREHALNNLAIDKAEAATDKRFSGVNGTREQMSELIRNLATKESVDTLTADKTRRWDELRKELDRRFDEHRLAITALEKGDVKQEGKGMGQLATVGLIVGGVGFVGTLLGILVLVANLATAR